MSGLLQGERVLLRPISAADTDNIIRWRNSEGVLKYFIDRRELTREGHENWLKTRVEAGLVAQYIIAEKETGRDIGTAFLRDIDRENLSAEFGFFIGEPDALGKGAGTESCRLLCRYGFEALGLERIFSRVISDNPRSAAVFLKAGFKQEAVQRGQIARGEGFADLIFFGLLKGELE